MSLELTNNSLSALAQVAKEPNLVLEIDGVSTVFGVTVIFHDATIIDDDLIIGDPEFDDGAFYIGGLARLKDQDNAIMWQDTSNSIRQTLNIDKGESGSISNMSVALIDSGDITRLITPGEVIPDILQSKCRVYMGFKGVSFPDDYSVIFRGTITEVSADAGKVVFQINSPDDKKRGSLFKRVDTKLSAGITNVQTTIPLSSVTGLLQKITGPSGGIDTGFDTYVRLGNEDSGYEIIKYTAISGSDLTGCTRGQFSTTPTAWPIDTEASSFYKVSGNCIDIALKLLASGFNGPFLENLEASSFGIVEATPIANSIYFATVDVEQKYNIRIGDYITTTGATNGANNVTLKQVIDVVKYGSGSYIIIDGVSFVVELTTSALVDFRSEYDVWPEGVRLTNDEIDFDEHDRLYSLFLSNFNYTFYLKDTIENANDFIEEQIYSPVAAYTLPRKSRASVGYHIGPIPGESIPIINENAVKSASKTKLKRTTNRNFYNEIVYKFDESAIAEKFLTGVISVSATSKNQIKGPNKTLTVQAKGLRSSDLGESIAVSQSDRRLKRYQFAAESIMVKVLFETGFNIEVGDIVMYDGSNLSLPDITSGEKGMAPRLFEVQNKEINLKTGDVTLEIVDTNFNGQGRYGLISPSSLVQTGLSATQFVIKESFSGKYGANEYRKWEKWVGSSIRVRNSDFSSVSDSVITGVNGNQITVSPSLSFTPSADMVFELTNYDDPDVTTNIKLVYGHMRDSAFVDGGAQYIML